MEEIEDKPKRGPGAPPGNQNAIRGKRWRDAITFCIEAWPNEPNYEDYGTRLHGIIKAAHVFVTEMMQRKDIQFFKEFGDRIDGKAMQNIDAEVRGNLVGVLSSIGRSSSDDN